MRGHCYDALVGIAGCDKSLPGMMMAMLRLNVPSRLPLWRLDHAGPFPWPRRDRGRCLRRRGPALRRQDVGWRTCACERSPVPARAPAAASSPPTPWPASPKRSVWRLPYSSGPPAVSWSATISRSRRAGGDEAGAKIPPARHPPARLRECGVVVAATGGSTNAALHLPAMAQRSRDQIRPVRRGRDLQEDALYRLAEAGRQICRQGHVGSGRRAAC